MKPLRHLFICLTLCPVMLQAQQLPVGSSLTTEDGQRDLLQLTTDHLGYGWYPADAASWDPVYLTDFQDYLIPVSDGGEPGLRYEKAGMDVLSLLEIEMPAMGGSNTLRNQPLTFFAFDDGADAFFDAYVETAYFGVSWVGDGDGTSAMRWRVDGGGSPYQVVHWWNHGLYDSQTLTVTLFTADGTPRAESLSTFSWPGNDSGNTGFTSFISVNPVSGDDYLIIENKGTNVGWRATAFFQEVVEPYSLYPLAATQDGYHFDDTFGYIFVRGPGEGRSTFLGDLYVAGYPWIYQYAVGWLYHVAGDYTGGLYLYSPSLGYLFTVGSYGGLFYSYEDDTWRSFD